ncbi:MAG: hypothetical protein IJB71_05250 [Bacilli bacterium]|nr:hypothetical protein [Bacilli bacterium]
MKKEEVLTKDDLKYLNEFEEDNSLVPTLDDVEVTYKNEDNLKKVPKGKTLARLGTILRSGIEAGLIFITTNKLLVWLGNIGQDEVIRWLQDKQTRYTYGTMVPPMQPNPTLAKFFEQAGDFVSISWATIMANPVLASAIIAFVGSVGLDIVVGIPKFIFKKMFKRKGKVETAKIKSK